MKVLKENPPNIEDIKKVFTVNQTTIFTYGDTVYNPNECPIDIPIMAHEIVHSIQQGSDPKKWWDSYLSDPQFRLEQEVEAYRAQYKTQCNYIKDRDLRALNLTRLVDTLSSNMYGGMISKSEARRLILWKPKRKK